MLTAYAQTALRLVRKAVGMPTTASTCGCSANTASAVRDVECPCETLVKVTPEVATTAASPRQSCCG